MVSLLRKLFSQSFVCVKIFPAIFLISTIAMRYEAKAQFSSDYRGTIIDAHSQLRCETNEAEIYTAIKKFGVAHTLLSAGGCNELSKLPGLDLRVLKLVEKLKGRASFLISPKKKFSNGPNYPFSCYCYYY